MWQRIPEYPPEPYRKLAQSTAEHCRNGLALIEESQTAQVANKLTISNIINSLRLMGQLEWIELIELMLRTQASPTASFEPSPQTSPSAQSTAADRWWYRISTRQIYYQIYS